MADQYLDDTEQDKLKKGLYAYLSDKARRRALETGSTSYEKMQNQFKKQEGDYDAGALVGALSEAGSMVGTLAGKRAESNIVPTMNKNLYESAQGSFNNYAKMRGMEEQANMNDLNVARYVSGLEQYDDQNDRADQTQESNLATADLQRQQLRKNLIDKYRLDPRIQAPTNEPVFTDDYGGAKTLPGYKIRPDVDRRSGMTQQDTWKPLPGVEGKTPDVVMGYDRAGNLIPKQLPKNFQTKTAQGEKDAANYYNRAKQAGKLLDEMESRGYRPTLGTALKKTLIPQELRGYALSEDDQAYTNAAEALAEAKLRKESGAAVPESEIKRQALTFMAQAGDSPATIAQKRKLRQEALSGLEYTAGTSVDRIGGMSEENRIDVIDAKKRRLEELRAKKGAR
jgi:hypothetical protein